LMDLGDLDQAMEVLRESERLSRELGNLDGLQVSLCNQAVILLRLGDLYKAMLLLKETERICRKLDNSRALAFALANQASVLREMGSPREALPLAEEAYRLATAWGEAQLTTRFESLMKSLSEAK